MRAYAKVNIFLKIVGTRANYHEIFSRFMRVDSLYDEVVFNKKDSPNSDFELSGNFGCSISQNSIYKAYNILLNAISQSKQKELKEFFYYHKIDVEKNIPFFAGLGGGSSDAATFLKMSNDILNLGFNVDELAKLGVGVGADVAFFTYGYGSANVSGIGEIVEEFSEDLLDFDIYTPPLEISTPKVYKSYREHFFDPQQDISHIALKNSKEVLDSFDIYEANDLYLPATREYKELESYYKSGYFFSGSGSSFFKVKE